MFQTFSPRQYLMIDIANNFGLEKKTWDERLSWFKDNEINLEKLVAKAAEPALFFAGMKAYRKSLKGIPTSYPISLDATASGIQILSVLTGDRKAARLCNVIDTGKREDAYTGLYELMCSNIGDKAKIDRKDTKLSIMTAFYASTAIPKKVFGEGKLLDIFYDTMKENAPGAWELNETMLALWDANKYVNEWVLPDNFHVKVKVMSTVRENVHFLNKPYEVFYSVNQPMENGRSLGANMTHSVDGMVVRELANRCMYDPEHINKLAEMISRDWIPKHPGNRDRAKDKLVAILHSHYIDSGFYPARILNYLDEYNIDMTNYRALSSLLLSLPNKPFEVIAVHDCFRVLPNYGDDLRLQYNYILSNLARSRLLSYILSQLLQRKVVINKLDNELWRDILASNYALS